MSYQIIIAVSSEKTPEEFRQWMQRHYDSGSIAGTFAITQSEQQKNANILNFVAMRYKPDDSEYIYPLIKGVITQESTEQAARDQYLAELQDIDEPDEIKSELWSMAEQLSQGHAVIYDIIMIKNDPTLLMHAKAIQSTLPKRANAFVRHASEVIRQTSNELIHENLLLIDLSVIQMLDISLAKFCVEMREADMDQYTRAVLDNARVVIKSANEEGLESGMASVGLDAVSELSLAINAYEKNQAKILAISETHESETEESECHAFSASM